MALPLQGMRNAEISKLALLAISGLASKPTRTSESLGRYLHLFCASLLENEGGLHHSMVRRMQEDGVKTNDIIDYIVPETARRLGEYWFADEIGFADVTIGTARLQQIVRGLAAHQTDRRRASRGPVLMVLPHSEDHTLGSVVAGDQIRRIGYDVDTAVDYNVGALIDQIRHQSYVMIGISASGPRSLAYTAELVTEIRTSVSRFTPVVLGGAVLNSDLDLIGITGACHTAHDVRTALMKCGLPVDQTTAAPTPHAEVARP